MTTDGTVPVVTTPRRSWLALGVAAASIFLFVFDSGLLSVSLPAVEHDFPGTSRATLSWLATGYLVALASFLLVAGRVADRRGRKRIYLAGLSLFSVGAIMTSLAPTIGLVIAARVVEGIGGAFMTASSLALVLPDFPPEKQQTAIGIWGGIGSLGSVLAPTVGAIAVQDVSWRLGFALVGALGLASLALGARVLHEPVARIEPVAIHVLNVVFGSVGLGMLALVLSQGRRWGWHSVGTLVTAASSALLITAFVYRAKREVSPLLDFGLFQFPQWTSNTLAAGIQQIGFFSWFLTTPLILVNVWGWSVVASGSAMALGLAVSAISGPLGGRWADRSGTTIPIVISAIVAAAGPGWLALTARPHPAFWTAFLPATLLMGGGGGICGMLTTGGALQRMPPTTLGSANSTHQLFRRICGMAGVAVALALLGDHVGPSLLSSARVVWTMVSVAHLVMCVPLLVEWWRSSRRASLNPE